MGGWCLTFVSARPGDSVQSRAGPGSVVGALELCGCGSEAPTTAITRSLGGAGGDPPP